MRTSLKTITQVPGWADQLLRAGKLTTAAGAYDVPLVHRAINLRCNSLTKIPLHLTRRKAEVDWPFPVDLNGLLWKTEAAILIKGASYWLKVTNENGSKILNLQWLNPLTMSVETYKDENGNHLRFWQTINGKKEEFREEQIVYIHTFNPSDDIGPGVSDAEVSLNSAKLAHYLTRFISAFFEGGAMPVVVLGMEGAGSEETQKAQTFFQRTIGSIQNAWRVIALSVKASINIITPPLKDMALDNLRLWTVEDVAYSFGIPKTVLLADSANRATADTEYESYLSETVIPEAQHIEGEINRQLLEPLGFVLTFTPEEMSIFQADEAERSGALLNLTHAGVPLRAAMEILGYEIPEEMEGMIDEATALSLQPPPAPVLPPKETTPPQGGNPLTDGANGKGLSQALATWQRKALKKLKEKGTAGCDFEDASLRPTQIAAIAGALEGVQTAERVRAIFANAVEWEVYP